jgi:tRNA modification GTPase
MRDADGRIWFRFESEMIALAVPDTIYALSSGLGRAGIAVVRLSGPGAGPVLAALTGGLPAPRVASLRKLKARAGQVIDESVVLWFPLPHSATGEDVVELHLHGAPAILEFLFAELMRFDGLRLAEPGEFSKRAFANGKLDLVEVEGLADLLAAQGEAQRRLAMRQFLGETSAVYERWRKDVIAALALHEAAIDFVEEDDVAGKAREMATPVIERLITELQAALQKSAQNAALRSGLRVVIAGAPNVGKSSLLNALAGREAAIVSPLAGTTRDVVEAQIMFEGLPLTLADTAGLRVTSSDAVEEMGMARAQAAAGAADILLWVSAPDIDEKVGPPRTPDLFVQNKSDLASIRSRNESAIAISTKTGAALNHLRDVLQKMIHVKLMGTEDAIVVRQRHVIAVQETIGLLTESIANADRPHELIAEDLRKAARALGSITGHVGVEDLLDKIFSEFCIGK